MRRALEKSRLQEVYDRTAGRYDRQHAFFTFSSDARGRRMVVERAVDEGDKVLDAGAGTGSTSLLAARLAGHHGKVVCYDLSQGMLEVAEAKAREAGLAERREFMTGDMLKMPFLTGSFDAVVSTYSLCPLYDPAEGARELYRVLRPGGLMGVAHSAEPRNTLVRWCSHVVESAAWRIPALTLGCRPVSVLAALKEAGAEVLLEDTIGVPLWPFEVFVVKKPS